MTFANPHTPVMVSTLAFFSILLFAMGVIQHLKQRQQKKAIIQKIRRGRHIESFQDEALAGSAETSASKSPLLNLFARIGQHTGPQRVADYSKMRIRFLNAGIRYVNAPTTFWGAKIFLLIVFSTSFAVSRISFLKLFDPTASIIVFVLIALAGFYLPDLWLKLKTIKRKRILTEGLPDVLDLLVVCVEAGMGLDAAINRVAKEISISNSAWSAELQMLNLETRAGKARAEAMKNLAVRTGLEDVNSLVALLIQTDRFGTSVAQTLRVYSDSFRIKRYQAAEEMAAKLPVKLVFPCILFIFPSLFVAIMGPAGIRIYQALIQNVQ